MGSSRARCCRATSAAIAGDVLLRWTRDKLYSTRDSSANPTRTAQPLCGHRRRRQRPWRTAVVCRKHGGDETKPRRGYGGESRGGKGRTETQAHHRDDGGDGEARGGSTAPESKTKAGGGGCGKRMMATKRLHPSLHGLARTERRSRRSSWWRRFGNGCLELRQWRIDGEHEYGGG